MPEPDPPTTPTTAPAGTVRSTPANATSSVPSGRAKTLPAPDRRTSGSPDPAGGRDGLTLARSNTAVDSRLPGACAEGTAASSALVYSCAGAPSTCRVGPCSTIRPSRSTATRSATAPTAARSWLISRTPVPASVISRSSASSCRCTVVSSAVVGSSATRKAGRPASAVAISTRWRSPPDSSCGYWSSRRAGSGTPTDSSSSTDRRHSRAGVSRWCSRSASASSCPIRRSGSSAPSASCWTNPTSLPLARRQSRRVQARASRPAISSRVALTRACRCARPSRARAVTLLPEPDSPTRARHSPAATRSDTPRTACSPGKVTERSATSSAVMLVPFPPALPASADPAR